MFKNKDKLMTKTQTWRMKEGNDYDNDLSSRLLKCSVFFSALLRPQDIRQISSELKTNQNINYILGQITKTWLSETISRCSFDQINASRSNYSSITVDICTIIQSTALRVFVNCNVVLHLCNRWHAGCTIYTLF